MSNRVFFGVVSIGSLVAGGLMYMFFRENTYISIFLTQIGITNLHKLPFCDGAITYLSFYLPDFLWAISLCSGLFAIFDGNRKVSIACGLITLLYGAVWEMLQYAHVITGTGDVFDIIMYLIAIIIAILLYKRREKNEKND